MNESVSIFDGLAAAFQSLISQVVGYLPKVMFALLVLIFAFLGIATLLSSIL